VTSIRLVIKTIIISVWRSK